MIIDVVVAAFEPGSGLIRLAKSSLTKSGQPLCVREASRPNNESRYMISRTGSTTFPFSLLFPRTWDFHVVYINIAECIDMEPSEGWRDNSTYCLRIYQFLLPSLIC